MLRFKVFQNGGPAQSLSLDGAHLLGTERVPLRAEMKFANGELICQPRTRGAAALAVMWPVKPLAGQHPPTGKAKSSGQTAAAGRMMLETTRLIDRTRPYILNVELARGHLMRISLKREDWDLYDDPDGGPVCRQVDEARDLLVAAISAPNDPAAAELGDAALSAAVRAGEAAALFNADIALSSRITSHDIPKRPLGCAVQSANYNETHIKPLSQAFDFAIVPFSWRELEPDDGKHQPEALDRCIQLLRERKTPIWGQTLLSFEPSHRPDWLEALSDDYDQLRNRAIGQIKYVLRHFGPYVRAWEVIGGIHAFNSFKLTIEQLMDLTRVSTILVKQMSPRSKAIVGISLPWGEYYATDPSTIPPLLYAQMAVESGLNFDAFGVELDFGGGKNALYVRDLMHISALLDRFQDLRKPLHVTAAGVPSAGSTASRGAWLGAWSEETQARWLREFYRIALSKPFVETVSWRTLADDPDGTGSSGLLRADLSPKPACKELLALRQELRAGMQRSTGTAHPDIDV